MNKFLRLMMVSVGFSLMTASLSAHAICFSSKQDYEKIKSKLPGSLQKLPAIFTVDGFAKAGVIINTTAANPDKLKLQMKVVSPMTSTTDEYIKSACLEGRELKVTLENNSTPYVVGISGDNLVVMSQTLVKSDMKHFNALLSSSRGGGGGMFGSTDLAGAQ